MNPPIGKWKLICPAEDASSAQDFEGPEAFRGALATAKGLGATINWQAKQAKLYVKADLVKPETPFDGVIYPSGNSAERHPDNNAPKYAPANTSGITPLVRLKPDIRVSKHFLLSEFAAKSNEYDGLRLHPKLPVLLDRIRDAAGCPVRITSGYRPPAYNRSVGGAEYSNHMDGTAADIYADLLTTEQLRVVCERILGNTGGLGYYPGQQFCHVDLGPYKRWTS